MRALRCCPVHSQTLVLKWQHLHSRLISLPSLLVSHNSSNKTATLSRHMSQHCKHSMPSRSFHRPLHTPMTSSPSADTSPAAAPPAAAPTGSESSVLYYLSSSHCMLHGSQSTQLSPLTCCCTGQVKSHYIATCLCQQPKQSCMLAQRSLHQGRLRFLQMSSPLACSSLS